MERAPSIGRELDSGFLDEFEAVRAGFCPPSEPDLWGSGQVHDAEANHLEGIVVRARALTAEQYARIAAILREAADTPEPWVGADPSADPAWVPRRPGESVGSFRRERREMAVRAAVADVAVRLRLSETTIRARAAHTETLRERCPELWAAFTSGAVPEQNALVSAQLAASLPDDDRSSWEAFDAAVAPVAGSLPPGKFRIRARVIRERVHRESLTDRHRRAAADRTVWLTPELDGMASVAAVMPADQACAAYARVDRDARHLHGQPDEGRTLAHLRADVIADLLIHGHTDLTATVPGDRPAVAITVPVLTLLGQSEEPATLDGYGPIDPDTARRMAGGAKSWVRILTHPVTGTVLNVDRTTYRVPKALRRWLGVRDPVCVFPGCTRIARDCQIDHRIDWQYGGPTADTNLAPQCHPHHRIKTETKWSLYRDPTTGATWWVSPSTLTTDTDPPPW